MSQPVKAIVFDVGRVIVRWQLRDLFAPLIDNSQQLDWFLANVVTEEWHGQADAGVPLQDMAAARSEQFPEYAHLITHYATNFLDSIPGPVPGTLELIEQLDAKGWPLFAITNFGAEFWDSFRPAMPVFDKFRDIIVSGQEKLIKPDPAIFALASTRFGLPPSAMYFIDDNAGNIAAARALGWRTHLFTDAKTLHTDLIERDIL